MSTRREQTPDILLRLRAFARTEALWQPGQHLVLAVSGGPDSVAMLDLLHACAADEGLRLAVAHIHHHLRPEADEDAAFVEALAARYDVPFLLAHADVPARVAATGESVETAARAMRYAALTQIAADLAADRIVTGHTADDQAETVLMRLLRGTGPGGLAGIPPRRDAIIRPLLPLWREEIMAYLAARSLPYHVDTTNFSTDFTRNRIRHVLLPHLETTYAPQLRTRLQQLAAMSREDAAVLDAQAGELYTQLHRSLPDGVMLPAALDLPRALLWRLWRLALAEVRGSLLDIGYAHLAAIGTLPPHGAVDLPGAQVRREGDGLTFLAAPDAARPVAFPATPLPVPGEICLFDAGCCLRSALLTALPTAMPGGDTALLDPAAIRGDLHVRSWQDGDRMRPLGAPGARALQDIFTDARVPRRLRPRVPLVLDDDGIIWIAGFRIADRVKIAPITMHAIRLSVEWELNPWTVTRSYAT